jgi:DNA primase large subunit
VRIEGGVSPLQLGDPETEICLTARAALVYASRVRWLVNRFATFEAKRCEELLKMEAAPKLAEVAKASFGWRVGLEDLKLEWERLTFSLGMAEYLEVAPQFHSPSWKLTNKYVDRGRVFLDAKDFARLLAENLKLRIIRKAGEEGVKDFELPAALQPHLGSIAGLLEGKRQLYEDEFPDGLVNDARPPCIVAIMNDLSAGKSLSHMARFAITTFMLNVGESVDGVLKLFGNVADFDEGKARYQVEHIAGITGSRTKYAPPKCEVLRSFGLCAEPDRLCATVSPAELLQEEGQAGSGAKAPRRGGANEGRRGWGEEEIEREREREREREEGRVHKVVLDEFRGYYSRLPAEQLDVKDFVRREYALLHFGDQKMIRHLSFGGVSELKRSLVEGVPANVYYSSAYYRNPQADDMNAKGWEGADLIFDIDADHIRTDCKDEHDTWACLDCGAGGGASPGRVP